MQEAIKPWALAACVLLSVSAHALLLSQGTHSGASRRPLPPAVRVLAGVPGENAAPAPAEFTEEAPTVRRLAASEEPASSQRLLSESLDESPQDLRVAAFANPLDEEESGYIPRPRLTLPPVIQAPVLLAWPEMDLEGSHSAKVSLFIDEQGIVRRVRIDTDGLPPAFQDTVRLAFLGARFFPGQLEGQDVKSRIRVEVTFDGEVQTRVQARGQRP